jgi:hypothetical protein
VGRTALRWVAAAVLYGALASESEGKLEKRKAETGSCSPFESRARVGRLPRRAEVGAVSGRLLPRPREAREVEEGG